MADERQKDTRDYVDYLKTQNTDELIAEMKRDELLEQTKMSPVEFGKSHGIQPQLVYYHIRAKHIKDERCSCGRRVIDVAEAKAFFAELEAKAKQKGGGINAKVEEGGTG